MAGSIDPGTSGSTSTQYVSTLAKDWRVEVDITPSSAATWTKIRGLRQVQPSIDSNDEDDSDFDSGGWGSTQRTQNKWKLELSGMRKRAASDTGATFTADPGQEFLRRAGEAVGNGSNVHVRFYRVDGDPMAYEGYASCNYGGGGGGVTDLEPFTITLNGQGARAEIDNPSLAGTDTTQPTTT